MSTTLTISLKGTAILDLEKRQASLVWYLIIFSLPWLLGVCFLAMNRHGEVGAHALHRGFVYAVCDAAKQDALLESPAIYATSQS